MKLVAAEVESLKTRERLEWLVRDGGAGRGEINLIYKIRWHYEYPITGSN